MTIHEPGSRQFRWLPFACAVLALLVAIAAVGLQLSDVSLPPLQVSIVGAGMAKDRRTRVVRCVLTNVSTRTYTIMLRDDGIPFCIFHDIPTSNGPHTNWSNFASSATQVDVAPGAVVGFTLPRPPPHTVREFAVSYLPKFNVNLTLRDKIEQFYHRFTPWKFRVQSVFLTGPATTPAPDNPAGHIGVSASHGQPP